MEVGEAVGGGGVVYGGIEGNIYCSNEFRAANYQLPDHIQPIGTSHLMFREQKTGRVVAMFASKAKVLQHSEELVESEQNLQNT